MFYQVLYIDKTETGSEQQKSTEPVFGLINKIVIYFIMITFMIELK